MGEAIVRGLIDDAVLREVSGEIVSLCNETGSVIRTFPER